MFRALRKHITPSTVIAFIALVFAVTGGAFAATDSGGGVGSKAAASTFPASTAKSKAKSKTKAGSRGPAGPKGATGATGAIGAIGLAGPQGAPGAQGPGGPQGPQGAAGVQGLTGKEGAPGAKGENGTTGFTETLPSGKTETGAWVEDGEGLVSERETLASFSFPIPIELKEEENGKAVFLKKGESDKEGCDGTVKHPTAPANTLCVYAQEERLAGTVSGGRPISFAGSAGFGRPGAVLDIISDGTAGEPAEVVAYGSWAVTAP